MARKKNALTGYFVAKIVDGVGTADYLELAKWVSSVTDDSDETTEDEAFYDGDGTPTTDVVSISERYSFEGFYDDADPAMKMIAGMKRMTGEGRKLMFRKVDADGATSEGLATATDIVVSGGEASEYATFGVTIAWDKTPVVTP